MKERTAQLGRLAFVGVMFAVAAAVVGLFAWDLWGAAGAALAMLVVGMVVLLAWGGD